MNAARSARVHGPVIFRAVSALLLTVGVFAAAAITFEAPAFADTPPTIVGGTGAFSTDPVTNLTGCTAASGATAVTCTSTAGVVVNEGAYGASLASGTSVSAVTPTTITLGTKTSAAVTATQVLTFTIRTAVQNVSGSTTTVTSSVNFQTASVTPGMSVIGPGIATGTSVSSVSGTSLVLSADPTTTLSGVTLVFNSPETFDVLTLVSGGAASVNTSSLTVVTQPPAGDGTVVASTPAGHGFLTLLPGDTATSAFSATFAYCAPGDTYSPGSPNCTTATMSYAPATDQLMGEAVTVSGISEDIYETTEIAAVQPATAQQGAPVNVTLAPVGSSVPSLQSTPIGNATVNYADNFTMVFPAPAGLTIVPGSFQVTGGDSVTEGVATAEYCTAAGTGCDAQINTGNYKTTYPYIELELPSADHVNGGQNFTLPTVSAQFTATGSVGTVASETLSEYRINTNVTVPIVGTENANLDAYPTSGNSGTPPYTAPVALGSTKIVTAAVAPSFTSSASTTFTAGSAGSFTVTTSGSPAPSISESGRPALGRDLHRQRQRHRDPGRHAGRQAPGEPTPSPCQRPTGTARMPRSPSPSRSNQVPSITSGSSTTFTDGAAGSFTVTTAGFPAPSLTETGALPSGVTFVDNGNGTATLAGTPVTGGTFPLTVKASNGVSPNANQSFTLTVDQAPVITSANSVDFSTGTSDSFNVTTTATPTAAIAETGALPEGVTFVDNGNGTATLSGTPAVGSGGAYPITITASNGVSPDASQSFTLTVSNGPLAPTITSGASATFTAGTAGTFTVGTNGNPTAALSETGALTSGVTFVDNGDGTATLSGTPAAGTGGAYPITITATNGVSPDATQAFTLTVDQAPSVTSGASTTFTTGTTGTFGVTTGGYPVAALSETGALPNGVTFVDNGDGTATLSGTAAAGSGGVYPITITASNGIDPDATQAFTLTVDQAAAITSAASTTFTTGTAGNFAVTSTGFPTAALSEDGSLPSGVTFTDNGDGTGTLSGTPAASTGGVYAVTLKANNGVGGTATESFTLTVDQAAAITSGASTTFTVGSHGTFTVTTTGFPAAAISENGDLPAGVSLVDNGDGSATLAGTPAAATGGSYTFTVRAINGVGTAALQSFSLTVNEAPSFTSADSATFSQKDFGSFTPTASGSPAATISEWGTLPKGVTFSHGKITGVPKKKGTYPVLLTASNGIGTSATQVFTLTVVGFAVTTTSLPAATVGNSYSQQLSAVGGLPPYKWKATAASLPPGLTLSTTGLLSGTPTTPGNSTISVTVTDKSSPKQTATGSITLKVQTGS